MVLPVKCKEIIQLLVITVNCQCHLSRHLNSREIKLILDVNNEEVHWRIVRLKSIWKDLSWMNNNFLEYHWIQILYHLLKNIAVLRSQLQRKLKINRINAYKTKHLKMSFIKIINFNWICQVKILREKSWWIIKRLLIISNKKIKITKISKLRKSLPVKCF